MVLLSLYIYICMCIYINNTFDIQIFSHSSDLWHRHVRFSHLLAGDVTVFRFGTAADPDLWSLPRENSSQQFVSVVMATVQKPPVCPHSTTEARVTHCRSFRFPTRMEGWNQKKQMKEVFFRQSVIKEHNAKRSKFSADEDEISTHV